VISRRHVLVRDDGPEAGAVAMERDRRLVGALRRTPGHASRARTHGWSEAVLSVGRTQRIPPDVLDQARSAGARVVRRPTGGGWLLHLPGDLSLTYADPGPLGAGDFRATARRVARALAGALEEQGVPAVVLLGLARPRERAEICFERADRDEVVVGSTKVCGVALARFGRAALVQSAVPLAEASAELAALAERVDPKRAAAAAALRGTEPERAASAALRAVAGDPTRSPPSWSWPAAWLERAGAKSAPEDGAGSRHG
jgi:lipoate-protein ligase A